LKKIRKTIEADIKKSFNEPFACKPDAQKAIDEFLNKHKNSLFDIKLEIYKLITEKNKVDRPSKNKEQSVIIEKFWVTINNLTENKERVKEYKDNSESFVLITNIPENEKITRKYFKITKNKK